MTSPTAARLRTALLTKGFTTTPTERAAHPYDAFDLTRFLQGVEVRLTAPVTLVVDGQRYRVVGATASAMGSQVELSVEAAS